MWGCAHESQIGPMQATQAQASSPSLERQIYMLSEGL